MEDETKLLDIYKIDTSKKINKKKIFILIEIIITAICLILIAKHSIKTINGQKVYKQYETQLKSILYQEEQEKAQIKAEEERKRQEKIQKLTQVRKGKN